MDANEDSSVESLYSWNGDLSLQCSPKYTLKQARTIDNHTLTDKKLTCTDQIPSYILNKLMIGDYRAREFKVKPLNSSKTKTKDAYDSDESDDEEESVNPMDALLWVFHCSDEFLRQYLALKLSECQLSVPFLLPDPGAPSEKVTILLSALENITKLCRLQQVFAMEHPFPVVSFIRIGKITMSKSSLINEIMSHGNKHHNFFCHKDVDGGDVHRKIVDGLVELSWYLPEELEKHGLKEGVCFANLRGDARVFQKQFHLLLKISSVLCILLPSEYPDENTTKLLEETTDSEAKVILLFNEVCYLDSVRRYFRDLKNRHRGKMSLITKAKKTDEIMFVQSIRANIQKKIHEVKPTPLVELLSCAREFGFQLDGKESHFTSDTTVDSWLGMGIKEAKSLLKLQMHVPALADLEREKYLVKHPGKKSEPLCKIRDIDKIYKHIEEVQMARKKSSAQMDQRFLHFLNSFAVMDTTKRNHTLNKLKHQLNKMSLQVLPKLHEEYRVASLESRDKSATEEKHLQHLEESISEHSFGLEHIIRELAQLYEIEESKYDYADAAADMLLSGQPLEILDGDSFYIPLRWFEAVFTNVEQITKNAKIFVISVVGIQSSGKSTLLNTMFRLEFPVSAGRCTCGVFARLLPVSDSTKSSSGPEYVLILDSEGFGRSSNSHLQEHDNEVEKFVIGVADLTIVNILGISRDVRKKWLERAVHAFLKMKLAREKKSCKIVHQTVLAADEEDRFASDRLDLKQDLDKIVKLAAIQENCVEQFQHFNEVVSFDENKDVFYIPSLYQESSQMAPRNPEYGRAVQRIKEDVITLMFSKEMYKYSISQFRERICNLWQAILRGQVDEPKHEDHPTLSMDELKETRRQKMAETKFFRDTIVKPVSRFTLQQARTVHNHILTSDELTSEDEIPDYIFKMLITANYHVREFELKPLHSNLDETEDSSESEDSDEDDDKSAQGINPMDAILSVFYNSDQYLRRYIAKQLSACQLSVPFLLPDPTAPSENVTILLSALENITKCWQDGTGTKQVFATEHPFPVVSFIRIGEPTMSKSSLINEIMSDGKYLNFFFHRDMKGGFIKRKFFDGLVELSWYLPGEYREQIFEKEICFSNLRGNAKDFKKQKNILFKISSVLCILLPSEYPDESMKRVLEEASRSITKVILIFNEIVTPETRRYLRNLNKHNKDLKCIYRTKFGNDYDFLQSVRRIIQKTVNIAESTSLVELTSCTNEYGIDLDDDKMHSHLDDMIESFLEPGIENAKKLMQLQTYVPRLADLEREKYRPKHIHKVYEKIEEVKDSQKKTLKEMNENMLRMLNCIAAIDGTRRNHTLNKMKYQLDKMTLQVVTSKFHEEYNKALLKDKKKTETCCKPATRLRDLGYLIQLENSNRKWSFGLEHIIRELAQLYQLSDLPTNDYAAAAAEMLLSGQPLEILDGDSWYIPLEWFKAVFTKLEQKTNNAKIFVISVLGVQSSGKSTMLNTMFGLEFPVSIGRTTNGVFASLIPVGDSLKSKSKFDYILVVDTGGLRGSADSQLREHDSELATFAIGVADLTIVNIFGENLREMKEFLKIAVHAFLKMKFVNEKKSCKIVHQNVHMTDAFEKLTVERVLFKEDLDTMTKIAAIQENYEERFKTFDNIISFDENKDVFYLPSLFQDIPPMAPVNPDYSRAVQKIRENIATLMCSEGSFKLSFSQFQERVYNLWEAILKENFIFSFRNM